VNKLLHSEKALELLGQLKTAVQTGSASELFDRPQHTFVGHFIGSPGMNFLPAEAIDDGLSVAGRRVAAAPSALRGLGPLTLGVPPTPVCDT
jgi:glycerol transport system ATP-binding protein